MKNPVIRALCIAACILLIVSLGGNIYAITNAGLSGAETFESICMMLTSVFAIYYILAGAKKGEGTTYFRIFMALFGLTMLMANLFFGAESGFLALMNTVGFGCVSILFVAKDLGKKWSVSLAVVTVLTTIPVLFIASYPIPLLTNTLLGLVTVLMVFAKYADKKARGSK